MYSIGGWMDRPPGLSIRAQPGRCTIGKEEKPTVPHCRVALHVGRMIETLLGAAGSEYLPSLPSRARGFSPEPCQPHRNRDASFDFLLPFISIASRPENRTPPHPGATLEVAIWIPRSNPASPPSRSRPIPRISHPRSRHGDRPVCVTKLPVIPATQSRLTVYPYPRNTLSSPSLRHNPQGPGRRQVAVASGGFPGPVKHAVAPQLRHVVIQGHRITFAIVDLAGTASAIGSESRGRLRGVTSGG